MKKKLLSLALTFAMLLLLVSSLGMTCLAVEPETIAFQELGTSAPPTTLGAYDLVTKSDGYSNYQTATTIPTMLGNITADSSLSVRTVPNGGWGTWSHNYKGRVYYEKNNSITLTMPSSVKAFVFYVEPNFGTYSFNVQMNNGKVYTKSITGVSGATGFGFYSTGDATIESVSVSTASAADGFGLGEIYVNTPIAVPSAPVLSATGNSITVQPVNGCEYSLDKQNWTDSNTFSTGIKPVTKYTVYMRYKKTASAPASDAASAQITTPKAIQSAPATPQVTISSNEISVHPINGCEYSLDKQNWTDNNTFSTGIKPVTKYTVYMRYKNTDFAFASDASSAQVTTPKAMQSAPATPHVTISGNGIFVQPINGCEYSLNNTTWTTTDIFDNLIPGSSYTVYVRYAESSTSLASKSTAVKVTIPLVINPSTGDNSSIMNPILLFLGCSAFLVALMRFRFCTHKRAQK